MDAVKFLKEALRMCESYTDCADCVLKQESAVVPCNCFITSIETEALDKLVVIIEKWAKEHPIKTRQDKFLEQYPDTLVDVRDIININPCMIEKQRFNCSNPNISCRECREKFWSEELKNE